MDENELKKWVLDKAAEAKRDSEQSHRAEDGWWQGYADGVHDLAHGLINKLQLNRLTESPTPQPEADRASLQMPPGAGKEKAIRELVEAAERYRISWRLATCRRGSI